MLWPELLRQLCNKIQNKRGYREIRDMEYGRGYLTQI